MSNHPAPLSERALALLRAEGPLGAHADKLMLFGRFVGAWDAEVVFYGEDGKEVFRQLGEWSFSWALDGRAIQDVLIYPAITEDSFVWRGLLSNDGGATWRVTQEMPCRRRAAPGTTHA